LTHEQNPSPDVSNDLLKSASKDHTEAISFDKTIRDPKMPKMNDSDNMTPVLKYQYQVKNFKPSNDMSQSP
jgi:hypothetical protein